MASNKEERQNKYWRDREDEALKHYLTDEVEYQRRIDEIYADMLDACQSEIDRFYRKYAHDEGISLSEAKKRVSKLDIAEYERKAKRYVADAEHDRRIGGGKTNLRGYYFSTTANAEMKLYNATMKINRLEMLKANIGLELVKGTAELETFMEEILQGRTEEELERQAGILGDTIKNNAQAAHAIVNASFHNATFSERLWQHQTQMKADLSVLLQRGLIQGKGNRELARELQQYFIGDERMKNGKKGAKYRAETLMRTELARVQTAAQEASFKKMGFEDYTFHANSGCCGDCQDLNGKHFKLDKMAIGENAPPIHPRCRCSVSAYSDRKEYDEWLDFLSKGGTTEEWNARKATSKVEIAPNKPKKSDIKNIKTLSNMEESIEWANEDLASHLEFCRGLPKEYHAPFDTFEREAPKWMDKMSAAFKKFDFATNTGGNAIVSILKDGKYKSIMETKTSNGHNDMLMRKEATSRLFSIYDDLDSLKPSDFEKYGYLGTAERAKNLYGDCRIVFKKENLWDRTTFTIGDSLAALDSGANRIPSFVSNPNIVSAGTAPFFEDMPSFNETVIKAYQDSFDSIEKHGYFKGQISNQDYVELQFHGNISLKDIDYIEVPSSNEHLADIQKIAKEKGVKIKVVK